MLNYNKSTLFSIWTMFLHPNALNDSEDVEMHKMRCYSVHFCLIKLDNLVNIKEWRIHQVARTPCVDVLTSRERFHIEYIQDQFLRYGGVFLNHLKSRLVWVFLHRHSHLTWTFSPCMYTRSLSNTWCGVPPPPPPAIWKVTLRVDTSC